MSLSQSLSYIKPVIKILKRNKIKLTVVIVLVIGYISLIPKSLFRDPVSTVILDTDGNLLGARVADDGQWRFPISDTISEKVRLATLAFEDRFFTITMVYISGCNYILAS